MAALGQAGPGAKGGLGMRVELLHWPSLYRILITRDSPCFKLDQHGRGFLD